MNVLSAVAIAWWSWMGPMLWQSSALIAIFLLADWGLRRRVWPQVRYALWLLVLARLVCPPGLSLPTSLTSRIAPPAIGASAEAFEAVGIDAPANARLAVSTEASEAAAQTGVPAKAARRAAWLSWLMAAWGVGVLLLGGGLAVKCRRLMHDLAANDFPATTHPGLQAMLEACSVQIGLRHAPRLVFVRGISSPAVFGLFRPVVLLPDFARKAAPDEAMRLMLLHELFHIRRGDLPMHALTIALQIVYWPSPLLWIAGRRLRDLREMCCDAAVATFLEDRTPEYRATLLAIASRRLESSERHGLGLLGMIERPRGVLARARWLEGEAWRWPRARRAASILAATVAGLTILPMARPQGSPPASAVAPSIERGEAVALAVADSGSPATAGRDAGEAPMPPIPKLLSNKQGYLVVPVDTPRPDGEEARTWGKKWTQWIKDYVQHADRPGSVNGRVAGPDGQGVPGTSVTLKLAFRLSSDEVHYEPIAATMTDEQGRFAFPGVPLGPYSLSTRKSGFLSPINSKFVLDESGRTTNTEVAIVLAQPIRGRLTDPQGRPASGIAVRVNSYHEILGSSLFTDFSKMSARTDANGTFSIAVPWIGSYDLAVDPVDYASDLTYFIEPGGEVREIHLTSGFFVGGTAMRVEGGRKIPVVGLKVGATSEDHASFTWVAPRTATTDNQGRFRLEHLTPMKHDSGVYHPATGGARYAADQPRKYVIAGAGTNDVVVSGKEGEAVDGIELLVK